ncbi:DNA polymerase III subunit psi [Actinobacillus porcinus]|uniref:DNA polymerase III subunit psi n=1 Tax=Actinobacillus porcinus TaxID=51048 RepID=A0ABY6TJR0_9PAST|nr:DNA polymerase III subunit psi [Actinobacillus porcinus]MDD7545317.1 DNA polymerase III subunit psi [Actinobacillus porcinus]MDY5847719.1 DNA polymerase III subunit psi [Actinobacillus porcinus]VFY92920.1 DNA polymerase III subunit psi [Actinobacillus porcinus]VTU07568.1 DNA polymerase III subunit psi [Actinobacillus porcinus]
MNRRDLLLQEMGITQWQLRRPDVLKGAVNIPVSQEIRLIVIAETALDFDDPFLWDLLRSVEIQKNECLLIDFDHAQHLKVQQPVYYWLLSENSEKIHRTFEQLKTDNSPLWQTEELVKLKQNAKQKRELWRQIQQSFTQSV